ncbi:substrate-binding domain-containing protein [Anaerosacchariphilus polymeriproducens]|uniref:LacI family transcriptional regulator n=1 Tax=Anaerosacchariphilus polymeriproducens TaxID=1812858 RepID=A0A371AVK9_9FIRM|nr:substrate-binding domain-containing protein [Anaerosacchariphilus polymeriproducens]RDU23571.1 LacI family transcriptional regulator [Anaerosacchariphilus polymeriproducens]
MRKGFMGTLLYAATAVFFTMGCGSKTTTATSTQYTNDISVNSSEDKILGNKNIIVISKSYQNQFYQAAFQGADDAAADLGVTVITNGPDAESNVSQQVEQVAAAINQKPDAIVLAACDPNALEETLIKAKEKGIPVIGFDSGVPGDKTGAVVATAATDNNKAGANVAENLAAVDDFQTAIASGTEESPTIIGVLAQDATSGSIVHRVDGFIKEMVAQLEKLEGLEGCVEVTGQKKWTIPSKNKAKVKIVITVPPSTSQADIQSAANTIFSTDHLVGVFAANQDAVNGVISATNDATDLDKKTGKYKDIFVVGFDAGKAQKDAIIHEQFLGSVTQDPYQMGYQAIQLAVNASSGKEVKNVDTGSKWYYKDNIEEESISILLYD